MYNPELTTESATQRVGLIHRRMEQIFSADDEWVQVAKATSDAVATELVRNGDLTTSPYYFCDKTEKGLSFLRASARGAELLWGQVVMPFFDSLAEHHPGWTCILAELALNAVEHGTAFCSNGLVSVGGVLGEQGAFLYVDQSPSAVMASTLQARLGQPPAMELLSRRVSGRVSGHGLRKAATFEDIEVNFEDIRSGLRSLIFSPGVLSLLSEP